MVFVISVTGANRLSLDLLAIIAISTKLCQDLLAISAFCNPVSQDLTAIIAFCIQKYKDFACLYWPGPTLNYPAICDARCQLGRDLTAIIAVRF